MRGGRWRQSSGDALGNTRGGVFGSVTPTGPPIKSAGRLQSADAWKKKLQAVHIDQFKKGGGVDEGYFLF